MKNFVRFATLTLLLALVSIHGSSIAPSASSKDQQIADRIVQQVLDNKLAANVRSEALQKLDSLSPNSRDKALRQVISQCGPQDWDLIVVALNFAFYCRIPQLGPIINARILQWDDATRETALIVCKLNYTVFLLMPE